MLITLMLWKPGTIAAPHFYISAYLEDNKDLYIKTMRNVSKNGDWENWCIFFLNAIEQQAIRNLSIVENIRTLYEDMKNIFSEYLSSKWSLNTLDFVFTNPVFRNNKFTNNSDIPPASAARFTRVLLEKKLISLVKQVRTLARVCEQSGAFLVLDEAYADYLPMADSLRFLSLFINPCKCDYLLKGFKNIVKPIKQPGF
jgi:Fic family protein